MRHDKRKVKGSRYLVNLSYASVDPVIIFEYYGVVLPMQIRLHSKYISICNKKR